jgi:hypothetical protein
MTDKEILLENNNILLFVPPSNGCQAIKIMGLAAGVKVASRMRDGAIEIDLDPGGINSRARRALDQEYEAARVAEKKRDIEDVLADQSARYHSIISAKDALIGSLMDDLQKRRKRRKRALKRKVGSSK